MGIGIWGMANQTTITIIKNDQSTKYLQMMNTKILHILRIKIMFGEFLFFVSAVCCFIFPESLALLWRAWVIKECRVSLAGLLAARLRSL